TPASATRLVFTTQPSTTAAGAAITPSVVVALQDTLGNTITGFGGNVTVAIGNGPSGAVLGGTATVPANGGVATFSDLSIAKAGSAYTLTAAAAGAATGSSAAFTITPATANHLAFTAQPSAATAGTPITPAVTVTARDQFGNTATAFTGTVTIALGANPGASALSGTVSVAATAGVASFSDLRLN